VVGVAFTLAPLGVPISVVVVIGLIVLAGVVVNNAIVLVDAVNQRRRFEGQALREAVVAAARTRLRPILVTTTTTVLGLLPLSLGFGEGAEIQRPLAITVMAGLSSATLLTLVVIPVLYERVEIHWERRFGRFEAGDGP
jgi:HAE1 family hydrophobic/amphiphilic exporter-1